MADEALESVARLLAAEEDKEGEQEEGGGRDEGGREGDDARETSGSNLVDIEGEEDILASLGVEQTLLRGLDKEEEEDRGTTGTLFHPQDWSDDPPSSNRPTEAAALEASGRGEGSKARADVASLLRAREEEATRKGKDRPWLVLLLVSIIFESSTFFYAIGHGSIKALEDLEDEEDWVGRGLSQVMRAG
eukprot:765590-Hanusia_phi.AAC.3